MSTAKNQCPVCRRKGCVPEVAFYNTDTYGGGSHRITCIYCDSALIAIMHKEVIVDEISVGKFDIDDWGNKCIPILPVKKEETQTQV